MSLKNFFLCEITLAGLKQPFCFCSELEKHDFFLCEITLAGLKQPFCFCSALSSQNNYIFFTVLLSVLVFAQSCYIYPMDLLRIKFVL